LQLTGPPAAVSSTPRPPDERGCAPPRPRPSPATEAYPVSRFVTFSASLRPLALPLAVAYLEGRRAADRLAATVAARPAGPGRAGGVAKRPEAPATRHRPQAGPGESYDAIIFSHSVPVSGMGPLSVCGSGHGRARGEAAPRAVRTPRHAGGGPAGR